MYLGTVWSLWVCQRLLESNLIGLSTAAIVRAVKDYELGSARGHGLTPVGRTTLVNHAALALFGHVRSTRGKQHLPLLPSRVASLAS